MILHYPLRPPPQYPNATFQMLNNHMGLVATTLKGTVGNYVVLNIMTVQITNMRAKFRIKLLRYEWDGK